MSDLISRSKVISVLKQLEEHSLSGRMNISNAIYLLEKQPIAYDIDKVVEELEKVKTINVDVGYGTIYKTVRKDVAIEIVKQGCVADDVCEWKQGKGGTGLKRYKNSCCNKSLDTPLKTAMDLKYCPYCGKNIKVVEQ